MIEQQRPCLRRYEGEPGDAFHNEVYAGICAGLGGNAAPVAGTIFALTGYRTWHKRGPFYCTPFWSLRHTTGNYDIAELVRMAYRTDNGHEYYYVRDLAKVWLPRWRCEVCEQKCPTQSSYIRIIHVPWHFSPCTKRCLRFAASPEFAAMHDRERRKWEEHTHALVCSPACHNLLAAEYQRITLDAKEKRKWLHEGQSLVRQVQALLPHKPRRSRSPQKESSHRRISAAS